MHMIHVLENGVWQEMDLNATYTKEVLICIICVDEIERFHHIVPLNKTIIVESLRRQAFTFDHQDKTDYIGVLLLNKENVNEAGDKFCLCAGADRLVLVHENSDQANAAARGMISVSKDVPTCISGLFISFLEKTISGHIEQHERIEDEIASLENAFLTNRRNLGPGRILILQKKLLVYKRYYEQLQYVLDDLQESKNGLIDEENMRLFTLLTRRIERLSRNALVLREYVTQVRESYEAETDISLNSIMRLFTVVTVIFLPLTLLVGWYGMNLQMPEYHWIWGYPFVIAVSALIVLFTVIIFKKNKWF